MLRGVIAIVLTLVYLGRRGFVGSFEANWWKVAGTLVPVAYIRMVFVAAGYMGIALVM